MSKNSGMGSKRMGSHTSKGLGKCSDKHSHQCGSGSGMDPKLMEYKHKKHSFDEQLHKD